MIPLNKTYLTGKELLNIEQALAGGRLSGNGEFTKACHSFFRERYGFEHVLLTHSGTAALEMAALLAGIKEGDEVIVPSYTFVSSANAFVLRGAKIVFADSQEDHPNICPESIKEKITPNTKAILVIHYAGMAAPMDEIMALADKHDLFVIEDAAHAIDGYYKGRALGSIGHFAAFSFHATKNVVAGEAGMLVVNRPEYLERSEYIWEKGTNRAAFLKGQVDKYTWVDIGSSFLPSEITAACLMAQLEALDDIQERRVGLWHGYHDSFTEKNLSGLAKVPDGSSINGHIYYMLAKSEEARDRILAKLREQGIGAAFHYQALHLSPYHRANGTGFESLPNAERYMQRLFRLPLFVELTEREQEFIVEEVLRAVSL